ncbi:arylesterase [Stappia sp. 28M-7]|uniref:arylesterase n=1 Tax=Stappia sp. 28M-7 TaxID=2762596 RepID=UPI00163B9D26|nr:arylesterase [Stappia sp. 28M-7]MBC2861266.1 arylesterase [Stappia sp. 28M-7]
MIRFVTVFIALAGIFAALPARAEPLRILALGDSLTAGYQLPAEAAFPVQLEAALKARGHDVIVINAGVSGDTTAAGLARLDWSLGEGADAVIVELGANDALRGLPTASARANLDKIVASLSERGIPVLLAGIAAPRNMGEEYVAEFERMYAEIAAEHDAILYPNFLEGIPISPETVLPDGIHPTQKGVAIIVERILPQVEKLIERAGAARG